jgi:hypothetical protein
MDFYGFCFNTSFKNILKEILKIGFKKLRYSFSCPIKQVKKYVYDPWLIGLLGHLISKIGFLA